MLPNTDLDGAPLVPGRSGMEDANAEKEVMMRCTVVVADIDRRTSYKDYLLSDSDCIGGSLPRSRIQLRS